MKRIYIDNLTGLNNFEYLNYRYHRMIKKNTYNLILIDFKNFKYLNDNFGHSVGDKGLIIFANHARQVFEKNLIVRRSGDEFIILTESDYNEIVKKIDLIHQKINESVKQKQIPIPFSFNAGIKKAEKNLEMTMMKADLAMYQAKTEKKRVALFEEELYQAAIEKEEYINQFDEMIDKKQLIIEKQALYDVNYDFQNIDAIYVKDYQRNSIHDSKHFENLRRSFRIRKMEMQMIKKIMAKKIEKNMQIMINLEAQTLFGYQFDFSKAIEMSAAKNKCKPSNIIFCINLENYDGGLGQLIKEMKKLEKAGFKLAIQGIDFSKQAIGIPIIIQTNVKYVKIPFELVKKSIQNKREKAFFECMIKILEEVEIKLIFSKITKENELELAKAINPNALVKGYLFSKEEIVK